MARVGATPAGHLRASEAAALAAAAVAAGSDDAHPEFEQRAVRLASILIRLTHEPGGDPDRFLDAIEVSMGANASALTQPEAEALERAGIILAGSDTDPTGVSELLAGHAQELLEQRQAWSVSRAASHLGVTASRVRQLLGADHLLALPGHDGRTLPRWQFTEDGYLPGIATFALAAKRLHPVALAQFMTRPNVDLSIDDDEASPVDWLTLGGDAHRVADLVEALAY